MLLTDQTEQVCYNCFQPLDGAAGPCPYCGFDPAENGARFPTALPMGTVLNGRYLTGRVLGQGGFGITYLAFDTQLQAKVAIKEYMPGEIAARVEGAAVSVMADTRSEDFAYGAERFREEARTLAKFIGHPNVAGVSSSFDENGTSYFVMDYIEGISFKSYIANAGGSVSVDEALNVMIPVLRALTAVHAEGFIHRDVTPDNIYISRDGNVKLLDFGSARYSIGDKSKSLDVVLKVGYAPKEQYIRRGRQGPYTDVYSCAACLYGALTGVLPPESLDRLEQDELVPVSQALPDIPEWLDRAILKGLAVQPEDRFQSAAEFLDAVENQIVVEAPSAPAEPVLPRKKKSRAPMAAAAAAVLAAAIGVGLFLGGRNRNPTPPATPGPTEIQQPDRQEPSDIQPEPDTCQPPPLKEAEVPFITIRGREYSTNLTYLDLHSEPDLTLTQEETDQLGYMINLRSLRVDVGPLVRDMSALTKLTELESLELMVDYGNEYVKPPAIPVLAGWEEFPKLRSLYINIPLVQEDINKLGERTDLTDLSFYLQGAEGGVYYDLSPLSNLTSLRSLGISDGGNGWEPAYVQSLEPLKSLTGLKTLWLGFNGYDDFSPLETLTELEELHIMIGTDGTTPPDPAVLEFLENMTNLRELQVYGYASGETRYALDLSPLADLKNLKKAEFYHITADWSPVEHLPGLVRNDCD